MSTTSFDRVLSLAIRLASAHESGALLAAPEGAAALVDADEAYAVQHRVLGLHRQAVGGWKVGAKSATGPIQGAPLPADKVLRGAAVVPRRDYATLGLELEIAFRFGRRFEPRTEAYSDAEVLEGLASMLATIEVVSTRYVGWPAVDKLAQLADLQNHGVLAVGTPVPYAADYPFLAPSLSFELDGVNIVKGTPANPAGDPRRLLVWLVNHASGRGIAITPEMVVTTGSCSGMHFVDRPGLAIGCIEGLPPVQLAMV